MASPNMVKLTQDNWEKEVEQSNQLVLVDFGAPRCGPCRALEPILDKLADQFAGKLKIGKLNIDENQDVGLRYDIISIPQLLFFKGSGQPQERLVGLQPERELVKVINRLLGA